MRPYGWIAALAAAGVFAGCVAPEPEAIPLDRVVRADGPPIEGPTIDSVVARALRRPLWLPQAREVDGGAWVHATPGMRTLLSDRATMLDAEGGRWRAELELTGYGRGSVVRELRPPRTEAWDDRVTLDRGPVQEWYVHTDRGLEQGFTLEQEPPGSGPVRLDLAVSGDLVPRASGGEVALVDGDGLAVVEVSDLAVVDADDRPLRAWFEVDCDAECILGIRFDDRGARWPVTVDPLYSVSLQVRGSGDGYTGYAVDIAQDFAIVGSPNDPTDPYQTGSAMILARNQGGAESWGVMGDLIPSDNNPLSYGRSVAIDGHTAVVGAPEALKAYIFEYDGAAWNEVYAASSGAGSFGYSLALQENVLAVGAPNANGVGPQSGEVAMFERDSFGVWGPAGVLESYAPEAGARFGLNLALGGDRLAVGSPGSAQGWGEVVTYVHGASGWQYQWDEVGFPIVGSNTGFAVSSTSDLIVAGAPGAGSSSEGGVQIIRNLGDLALRDTSFTFGPPGAFAFGSTVATDGKTLAVGGFADTPAGRIGRVWLYDVSGAIYLTEAIDVVSANAYPPQVAVDEGLLIIGKPEVQGGAGRAEVFRMEGDSWVRTTMSAAGIGGAATGARAGTAVAIEGTRAAVGLPYDDAAGSDVGSVVILDHTSGAWTYERTLTHPSPGPAGGDHFGNSLALHDSWLSVGAPASSGLYFSFNGSAHLFDLNDGSATPAVSVNGSSNSAVLGNATALTSSRWAVGAAGAELVRVYDRTGPNVTLLRTLTGAAGSDFGRSVALNDRWLVVGSPDDDSGTPNAGSAFAYDLWQDLAIGPTATLSGTVGGERYGRAVALAGDTVLVGIPNYSATLADQGAVRAFTWDGNSFAPDGLVIEGGLNEQLGWSLATSADRLLVGSNGNRAILFQHVDPSWNQIYTPTIGNLQAGELLGRAVDVWGSTVLIGSPAYDSGGGTLDGRVHFADLTSSGPSVALDDLYVADEGATVVGNVLGNDYDPDGSAFQVTNITPLVGVPGTFTPDQVTGDFSFAATDPDDNGDVTFTYTVTGGDTALVLITLNPVNDPPVGISDNPSGPILGLENTQLVGPNVLANDYDVDDPDDSPFDLDAIEAVLVTDVHPDHGVLSLDPDGSWTFDPAPFWNGDTSFAYQPWDGLAFGEVVIVEIFIDGVNQAPTAIDHAWVLDEDDPLVIDPPGLLDGADDVDHNESELSIDYNPAVPPAHGTVVFQANGAFTYTPDRDYYGPDSFEYTVTDGDLSSEPARVDLVIQATNDAPIAVDDSFGIGEDPGSPLQVTAPGLIDNDRDPDGDTLTATIAVNPSMGNVYNFAPGTGSFEYMPDPDAFGLDTFEYEISDPSGLTDRGTVSIWIGPVNDLPIAVDDAGFAQVGPSGLVVDAATGVLPNDVDVDGDPLTAFLEGSPAHGEVELDPDGSFRYTPDAEYLGNDSFFYVVTDGVGMSNAAEVQLAVNTIGSGTTGPGDTGGPGCTTVWYADADQDGFGNPDLAVTACDPPEGTTADGTDCDDSRSDIFPGAEEYPDDGVDQDCSGRDAIFNAGDATQCSCSSAPGSAVGWLLLALPIALRRRDQTAARSIR